MFRPLSFVVPSYYNMKRRLRMFLGDQTNLPHPVLTIRTESRRKSFRFVGMGAHGYRGEIWPSSIVVRALLSGLICELSLLFLKLLREMFSGHSTFPTMPSTIKKIRQFWLICSAI